MRTLSDRSFLNLTWANIQKYPLSFISVMTLWSLYGVLLYFAFKRDRATLAKHQRRLASDKKSAPSPPSKTQIVIDQLRNDHL